MPESARGKGSQTGTETGFLAFRRHPEVDVIAQPVVRVLIPAPQVPVGVLGRFETPRAYVLQPVPEYLARSFVEAVVSHSREDAGAFGQGPDAVVLQAGGDTEHVQDPDPTGKGVTHESLAENSLLIIHRAELQEGQNPG